MNTAQFLKELRCVTFDNAFNPYRDRCERCDVAQAPAIRRRALILMLEAAVRSEVDSIWIGRDLGYRGGRRTGLAFTDDRRFDAHCGRWNIKSASPTVGNAVHERTAAAVWKVLSRIQSSIFLWNVFPFHPHLPARPFSNRAHKASERKVGIQVLSELITIVSPKRLVCVGADAGKALAAVDCEIPVYCVRHPSFGGNRVFADRITSLYGLA
ncbi:MAG: uracil-DNA glycosylase [Acidiferrobacterales bacterium]|nr:uracil-DNA glycosylase [Acidiferrobacterales bacterium]